MAESRETPRGRLVVLGSRRRGEAEEGWRPPWNGRRLGRWLALLLATVALAVLALWRFAPERLPDAVTGLLPRSPGATPVVYRYRDDEGRIVVSDRPPADGRPYEKLAYHPERNVVPGLGRPPL